ncbi:hypothetical protein LguiA_017677 [Lonicera macranthoides]
MYAYLPSSPFTSAAALASFRLVQMTIEELPNNVVEQFLSMLPVISLLRCRSVCKVWCLSIDDPSFIAKHLNRATTNKNECLLVKRFVEQHSKNVLSFVSEETLDVVSTDVDVLFFQQSFIKMSGHCNGIICLGGDGDIVLFNPATREFKALPPCIDDYLPGLMQTELGWDLALMKKAMITRLLGSLSSVIIIPMVALAIP